MPSSIAQRACCAIVFVASAATAETPPTPLSEEPAASIAKDEARLHFQRGVQLFEKEAWEPALAEFRNSLERHPTRAATTNAALCLRRLARYDEAYEVLARMAAQFPQLTGDERREYEAELGELAQHVGELVLQGVLLGSQIFIDDRERGTTPLRGELRASAGARRLRLTKPGIEPLEQIVQVIGGQSTTLQVKQVAMAESAKVVAPARSPTPAPASSSWGRVNIGAEVSPVFAPSLGGDLADCSAPCRSSLGVGARILGRAGFSTDAKLWSFAVDAGYLGVGQTTDGRATAVVAPGRSDAGSASDSIHLKGVLVGGSALYQSPGSPNFALRLGSGLLLASVLDERNGRFSGPLRTGTGTTTYAVDQTARRGASYLYASMALTLGIHANARIWLAAGVDATALVAIHQPAWSATQNFVGPAGDSSFASDSLTGRVVILFAPVAMGTYQF